MDIKSKIVNILKLGPQSAKEIAKRLKIEKVEINRILYHDSIFVQESGTPPVWRLKQQEIQKPVSEGIDTVVLIDLGNCPQCLKEVESYAQGGEILVYAFADYAYQGYGSDKMYNVPNVTIMKITQPKKNAADTLLIWICQYILSRRTEPIFDISMKNISKLLLSPINILVVTKDQGFSFLEDIVKSTGNNLSFHREWNDLKMVL